MCVRVEGGEVIHLILLDMFLCVVIGLQAWKMYSLVLKARSRPC